VETRISLFGTYPRPPLTTVLYYPFSVQIGFCSFRVHFRAIFNKTRPCAAKKSIPMCPLLAVPADLHINSIAVHCVPSGKQLHGPFTKCRRWHDSEGMKNRERKFACLDLLLTCTCKSTCMTWFVINICMKTAADRERQVCAAYGRPPTCSLHMDQVITFLFFFAPTGCRCIWATYPNSAHERHHKWNNHLLPFNMHACLIHIWKNRLKQQILGCMFPYPCLYTGT
jgi:hypothetical protein